MATNAMNGELKMESQLSDKAGKMDGRGLVAHYNHAFLMEDEEVPMEIPNGIWEASESYQDDDDDLYFELSIGDTDERFGFSVMGGKEEGFLPKVDEIVSGSPADRSDLQVGDEIIAVNGRSLSDASHAEVIAHIHQCVKSKTINLRVKRRMGKSIESDPESRRIQEAYVIAVEQQTKDKIGHIATKNNVPTTDLTNLPPLEQHPASTLNGYIEPNITVNNNNKDEEHYSYANGDSPQDIITHRKISDPSGALVNGRVHEPSVRAVRLPRQKRVKIDGWLSNSESSTDDCRDFDVDTSRTVTANVEIPPHGVNENIDWNSSVDYTGELVKEPRLESIELEPIKAPPDFNELEERLGSGDNLGLNNNVEGVAKEDPEMPREVPVDVPANMLVHSPNGVRNPREVAVDCPASFVAASGMKNPPQQYHNSNNKHGNNHHVNGPSNGVANGPTTMVNGSDHALINSHQNSVDNRTRKNNKQNAVHMQQQQQQNDTRQKVPNDKRVPVAAVVASGKVALPPPTMPTEQNASQNNSQGATVFEPASTRPLFDGKASTSSDDEYQGNNKKTAVGLDELFSSLEHVQAKLGGAGDQTNVSFLQELFRNSDFQHAVRVHKQVEDIHRRPDPPLPHAADADQLAEEIVNLTQDSRSREADELRRILDQPSFRSLLNTHDTIASRDPGLMLPVDEDDEYDHISDDAEDSVKIVRIDKTAEPLGATILNDGDAVVIGRIVKGGMAERSGLLHEGDEILEINGQDVKGKSVNQICDIMSTLTGTLTFLLIPSKESTRPPARDQSTMVHVRAHFDYDPEDDMYIPCRELGLSFHKGDILHVINQEDSNWWQAYREGEEDQSLAGLIPSRNFQQQREAMKQTMPDDEEPKKKLLCGGKRKKKKKKKLYSSNPNEQETDEVLTYEEVSLYTPVNKKKRPVVLIGPPKVGRHELRQRLLEGDDRFAAAVPHTSRTKRDHETDGVDYHFLTKQKFEQDIVAGKFVEHGEFEKSIYGTSLDSIRTVVETGKICILNLHPQALKILKNSDLKPYFIFVCPPQLDRLRQQRTEAGELLKEEELREIIETGRAMEDAYGHYFDYVIIHYDHDRAYTELVNEINRIESEPSWVPSSWLH
ncbi:uncharacterized protein [Amphiura filiformis]|uniref:uncharacterized protein isoform X2 n=1 Tax=Amphiura filiformis TaxID=82378 RepID=UPI003B20CB64